MCFLRICSPVLAQILNSIAGRKALEIIMQNEFRLTVSSKSVNEGFARVVVSAFAAPLDPRLEELA